MTTEKNAYIGRRIRQLRWQQGMPQPEILRLTGLTMEAICAYEAGTRAVPPDVLERIAAAQGVSPRYYTFGFDDDGTDPDGE